MQTHRDDQHTSPEAVRAAFDDRLKDRAAAMVASGESKITAGAPGESPINEWVGKRGVTIREMVDDEQGILRISLGGKPGHQMDYCVFRGDRLLCASILREALADLEEGAPGK